MNTQQSNINQEYRVHEQAQVQEQEQEQEQEKIINNNSHSNGYFKPYYYLLKRNRLYFSLWCSGAISQIGDWLNLIATFSLAQQYIGGSLAVSLVFACRLLPRAVLSSIAGPIADRFDRRSIMIITDAIRFIVILLFLTIRGKNTAWLVFVLTFLHHGFTAFFFSARRGLIPDLVSKNDLVLANTLSSTTSSVTMGLGSALSGLATVILGVSWCYVLDAFSFIISAAFLLNIFFEFPPFHVTWRHVKQGDWNWFFNRTNLIHLPVSGSATELEQLRHSLQEDSDSHYQYKNDQEEDKFDVLKEDDEENFKAKNQDQKVEEITQEKQGGNLFEGDYSSKSLDPRKELNIENNADINNHEQNDDNDNESNFINNNNNEQLFRKTNSNSFLKMTQQLFQYYHANLDLFILSFAKASITLVWGALDVINIRLCQEEFRLSWDNHKAGGGTTGMIYVSIGIGMLIGPVISQRFTVNSAIGLRWFLCVGFYLVVLGAIIATFSLNFWMLAFGGGILRPAGEAMVLVYSSAILQMAIHSSIRGRVFAFDLAMRTIAEAIGSISTGILCDYILLSPFQVSGIFTVVAASLATFWTIYYWRFTQSKRQRNDHKEDEEQSVAIPPWLKGKYQI